MRISSSSMRLLLSSDVYHGIATPDGEHDHGNHSVRQREKHFADRFEFQMLYGIRRDLQQKLVRKVTAASLRAYGRIGIPISMRRLAERPANVWFVLRKVHKG